MQVLLQPLAWLAGWLLRPLTGEVLDLGGLGGGGAGGGIVARDDDGAVALNHNQLAAHLNGGALARGVHVADGGRDYCRRAGQKGVEGQGGGGKGGWPAVSVGESVERQATGGGAPSRAPPLPVLTPASLGGHGPSPAALALQWVAARRPRRPSSSRSPPPTCGRSLGLGGATAKHGCLDIAAAAHGCLGPQAPAAGSGSAVGRTAGAHGRGGHSSGRHGEDGGSWLY